MSSCLYYLFETRKKLNKDKNLGMQPSKNTKAFANRVQEVKLRPIIRCAREPLNDKCLRSCLSNMSKALFVLLRDVLIVFSPPDLAVVSLLHALLTAEEAAFDSKSAMTQLLLLSFQVPHAKPTHCHRFVPLDMISMQTINKNMT